MQLGPQGANDLRAPTWGEFDLDSRIQIHNRRNARVKEMGWLSPPSVEVVDGVAKTIKVDGSALLPVHPSTCEISTQISLPALGPSAITFREDHLYLVGIAAEVGAEQDPILGTYSFQYQDGTGSIETLQKENTRRYRAFWMLIYGENELTEEAFLNLLQIHPETGGYRFTFENTDPAGFPISTYQVYAMDPNIAEGGTYTILQEALDILPVSDVRRIQNYQTLGYTWGIGGEEPLDKGLNLVPAAPLAPGNSRSPSETFFEICAGRPGTAFSRTVQNLTAGPIAGNPGRAGVSAGSPNGSVCLGNGQRVSFTNQMRGQSFGVQPLNTVNDGSGNAIVTAILNSNSPLGSRFSERKGDHRIYTASGQEESSLGSFSITENSLSWTAGPNSSVSPGSQIYFVPSIVYPSGSGFSIPFQEVEKAWLGVSGQNIVAISQENIRVGHENDIMAYEAPANGENYFVVVGPERAAIHYILKKVSVTTDPNGTALIPPTARGCFAFMEGYEGRIDAPALTGLIPNTTYNALIYHPPGSTESWQFQIKYAEYQGLGADHVEELDGAVVAGDPFLFVHTQGGGTSVYQGEGSFRYSPIAMHLPSLEEGIRGYQLDAPIQFEGQEYQGPDTFAEAPLRPASALALPKVGQRLSYEARAGRSPNSLNVEILLDGVTGGFRSPSLVKGPFQSVLVVPIRTGSGLRLFIATFNGSGAQDVALDSARNTAIDLFRI